MADYTCYHIERCVLQVANVGLQALEAARDLKLVQLIAQHNQQHANEMCWHPAIELKYNT